MTSWFPRSRAFVATLPGMLLGTVLLGGCGARDRAGADSATVVDAAVWNAALVDSLERMAREDQQGRDRIGQAAATGDTATLMASMQADSARSRWLRRAVRERGWPKRATAGDSAVVSAWRILQHSPFEDWQAEMLPTLEALAAAGEIPRSDVALLTDRVLGHRGEPQRYGSQFDVVEGKLVAKPIADLAGLDARRAAVGLPPMAEYAKMLGEMYRLPVVWPPR